MNLKTGPITVLFVYIIWCRLQLDDDILFGSVCEIEFCKFVKFILELPDLLSIALHYYATSLMIIKIIDRTTCLVKDGKSSH